MSSQPGEGAVLQENQPLPSSAGEGNLNPDPISNEKTETSQLEAAKSPAIKANLKPEESGANHAVVGTNGTLSPKMNGHSETNGQHPMSNGVAAEHQENTPAVESQESQQPTSKVEPPVTTSTEQKPEETISPTTTTSAVESGTAALQLGSDAIEDTKMESPILPQGPSDVTHAGEEQAQSVKGEAPSTPPQSQPSETPKDTEMTPAPPIPSDSVSAQPEQQPTPQPVAETYATEGSSQVQETKEAAAATPEVAAAASEEKPQTPTQPLNPPDQVMSEAPPPASPMKVARGRDEDASEEPAAKRAKTDGVSTEESQFKVPNLPTASAASNGLPSTSKPISKLQTKFLTRCLVGLKRTHDSRFFRVPVDPVKLNIPSYPSIIKEPMDLGTIESKLRAGQYATVDAVISDFKLMVDNSTAFNGPEHIVTTEGRNLFQAFERHLSKLPNAEQVEPAAEKKTKKAPAAPKPQAARREPRTSGGGARAANAASPTFALGPEGLPLIRRDSTTVDGRPKRSIHPPKNRDLPYSVKPKKKKFQWELKFCQEVLDELYKPKHYNYASPFYHPVDPVALNIPTYHNIIKKPMDLSTVQEKLHSGQYENAKEMEIDVKQIFKNCYKFNIPGDPTYNAGKHLEEIFDHKWSQKGRWLENHEPSSGHQSVGSTDESDNDEEESDDNEEERLHLLQKQIAEMSKQVEAISKKKKSPPTASKKSKAKTGKKDAKKSSSGVSRKDKKGVKPSRPEKQRWVTYQEKQVISNGISSLPDKKMSEALRIIQQNVPSLKGSNETEIELDIDELPNDVLIMLLKFVKKHAPQMMEYDEPPSDPIPSSAPSKPKKSKPMNKYEQEQQIKSLQGRLSKFQGDHSSDPVPEAAESSDDDEDSEESEEE